MLECVPHTVGRFPLLLEGFHTVEGGFPLPRRFSLTDSQLSMNESVSSRFHGSDRKIRSAQKGNEDPRLNVNKLKISGLTQVEFYGEIVNKRVRKIVHRCAKILQNI